MSDFQISKNFFYHEFYCQGKEPPGIYKDNIINIATELQKLRSLLNKPIRVNSGWRCAAHNKLMGGASNSQHLIGKAADCRIIGFPNNEVGYFACRYTNCNGIGIGLSYTHLDIRDGNLTIWFY